LQVKGKSSNSSFWKGFTKVKNEFFEWGCFNVGDDESTRFWEDTWLGDSHLSNQYLSLFNIVQRKQV
jgi:hypothetical protein